MTEWQQTLGDWLRPGTPLSEVCAFAEKVFLRQDRAGFAGDPKYVASAPACQNFSKLRSSIAGLYSWRARNDPDPAGQRRMAEAADFAFRQAFALDPRSPGAVFGLAQHLLGEHRPADALLVAETASKMAPGNSQVQLLTRLLWPHQHSAKVIDAGQAWPKLRSMPVSMKDKRLKTGLAAAACFCFFCACSQQTNTVRQTNSAGTGFQDEPAARQLYGEMIGAMRKATTLSWTGQNRWKFQGLFVNPAVIGSG